MITDHEHQQAVATLGTARDCLRWGESALRRSDVFLGHGTDDPWDEALALLLHVLSLPWETDPRILDARLLPMEVEAYVELMRQRINERVPAAYLTGEAWFCGLPFRVNEQVLIPRSPIAELIEAGFQPWLEEAPDALLDLCTGSGCIAIACAHAFPDARVLATDISDAALAVARENVAEHGLDSQVTLLQGDGLAPVKGQRVDLLVSNPPYVDAQEMAAIPAEYGHEPEMALASGDDGLDFTVGLLAGAAGVLSDRGVLVVEVGNSQAALSALFPQVPFQWLAFERGGEGVFVLTRADLDQYQAEFSAEARKRAPQQV